MYSLDPNEYYTFDLGTEVNKKYDLKIKSKKSG